MIAILLAVISIVIVPTQWYDGKRVEEMQTHEMIYLGCISV